MLTVSDVVRDVSEVLQDTEHIVYTESQIITSVNHACLATVLVKPEACSGVMTQTLVEGDLQDLPEGALRLLDVYDCKHADSSICLQLVDYRESRNFQMASGTLRIKRNQMEILDWSPDEGGPVRDVNYDERLPDNFWVYPDAVGGEQVRLLCSQQPETVSDSSDDLPLPDKYGEPVTEYTLYLLFRRDSERTPNVQRATAHRQAFFDLLQVKTQADMAVSASAKKLVEGGDGNVQ